jgi:chemosensory pili system protein ChpA (sensor histidine kinase/response regulator)
MLPLLMVRSGEHRAAIQVDGLLGTREIVVKPVGPQLSTLRGVSGATIMGDGSVLLILDLHILVRQTISKDLQVVSEEKTSVQPTVMVVDDSITVRKVTTRLLERHDYRVVSAKDGVDALNQLNESQPDVVLLDVEMPRMDGFELATNMRNDEKLKNIPVIMITSRTGDKHRERAFNIGVNMYMGKPFNEDELLENIRTFVD